MKKITCLWAIAIVILASITSCSNDESNVEQKTETPSPIINTTPVNEKPKVEENIPTIEEKQPVNIEIKPTEPKEDKEESRSWRKPRSKIKEVWANNDYTCYTFTEEIWACNYTEENCSDWVDWKRTCDWVQTTNYINNNSFACSSPWQSSSKKSINASCSVEETDNTAPEVEGWIK